MRARNAASYRELLSYRAAVFFPYEPALLTFQELYELNVRDDPSMGPPSTPGPDANDPGERDRSRRGERAELPRFEHVAGRGHVSGCSRASQDANFPGERDLGYPT